MALRPWVHAPIADAASTWAMVTPATSLMSRLPTARSGGT